MPDNAALAGFCIYGFAAGSPSTAGYLFSVLVIGAAIVWLRRGALPDLLAIALAIAAILHLAGGLINGSCSLRRTRLRIIAANW